MESAMDLLARSKQCANCVAHSLASQAYFARAVYCVRQKERKGMSVWNALHVYYILIPRDINNSAI